MISNSICLQERQQQTYSARVISNSICLQERLHQTNSATMISNSICLQERLHQTYSATVISNSICLQERLHQTHSARKTTLAEVLKRQTQICNSEVSANQLQHKIATQQQLQILLPAILEPYQSLVDPGTS